MINNYRSIWQQKRPIIEIEAHLKQYLDQRDVLGSTHTHSLIYAHQGIAEEFHRAVDNDSWSRLGRKYFKHDFVLKLLADGKKLRADFHSFQQDLNHFVLTQISNNQLLALLKKAYFYHSRFRAFFKTSGRKFHEPAEQRLKKLLASKCASQQIFETLTTPAIFDEVDWEFIDWLILLDAPVLTKQKCWQHLERYPWLVAHTYSEEEILTRLHERSLDDKNNLLEITCELRKKIKQKNALVIKQEKLSCLFKNQKLNYLAWLLRELSLERMRLKGGWAGSGFYYLPLFDELTRRTGIDPADLTWFYRLDEISEALKTGKRLTANEIAQRKKVYVFCLNNGKLLFASGPVAEKIIAKIFPAIDKQLLENELTGQIASLGQATGIVRVIIPGDLQMLQQDLQSFLTGEILITTMTQPNMVPIMKRAAGIVTDEGGLTSHAAIIAREFKIPCLVGTNRATKVFHTGDTVMVDANEGRVMKIA
ncbi:MAG: hypothetical protein A2445_02410 [Candidatus Jacksonbacteria bacterium RIFOXYC2_FULL_44_29]|nr:MAG: Pyruvate, water dikinase [Parcubacteria group bacterium GW2011_GWC2_44_22]OGY74473.1 MAG: hypothetical protein A2240_02670 [Candidatus Jacksonbacteria bacterium RIFOXYA2_FULL_43_12]OGY77381.1 MAG: hypothetical protein A2295_01620 [Candidatus Jacksonbacteria bacterium RIFOXYB2_FULL_44_15]OGY78153.1 MAG: hypothetical protein A2550_05965 [Candidatus Jacksonbacteria bacterium RIFOXYD2_FULL_43_21]OGY80729.1 MAG: hypothetical protein A2445_02410 [Candidatus Jacksonbacteria bacterium RIFOXYC2_